MWWLGLWEGDDEKRKVFREKMRGDKMKRIEKSIFNLLENDKKYKISIFIIILLAGVNLWIFRILMLLGLFSNPHGGNIWFGDFSVYYNAANLYLDGENFYDAGLLYPPLSIIFLLPLGYFTFEQACFLISLLNLFLLFLIVIIISEILQYHGIFLSNIERTLIFISIFLFYPISTSFVAGQINISILFLIILSYYYIFVKGKTTYASIFLSVATILKVWPFILIFLNFFHQKAKGLFIKYLSVIGILSIASIFLFGFSLHIRFFRTFLNFQKIPISSPSEVLQPSNAVDTNASPSNTIFKLLSLFNPPDISPTSIQLFWTILKIIFVVFLLYYLYKLSRKGEVSSSAKWGILTFSLLIILVLVASNTTWLYYASFLVLPYILFLFVLKLDVVEKALLMVSLILFSIQEHVIFLSNLLGGKIASIVYIAGPTTYAYLLFLILILYSIRRFETQGK